jgi:hypothetical protein
MQSYLHGVDCFVRKSKFVTIARFCCLTTAQSISAITSVVITDKDNMASCCRSLIKCSIDHSRVDNLVVELSTVSY